MGEGCGQRWWGELLNHSDIHLIKFFLFFSKSFMVSWLTYRSLIHFEFTFVYGVRQWSSFILLLVVLQFYQHHLLKRLSFTNILPYSRVSFCSIDGVFCCTEAFQIDVVPFVHFCLCFPCPRRCIQEKAAHVYIQEIFAYVFF